jgi:hypothetical protein
MINKRQGIFSSTVVDDRTDGPILRNTLGGRMDRRAATRRLKHLAATDGCGCRGCIRTCGDTPS